MGYEQLPGSLPIAFRRGDTVSTELDFSISLTGSTVSSQIVSVVSGSAVTPLTTTVVDAGAGIVNIGLTRTQTAALAVGTYRWELSTINSGDAKRTYLLGFVEVT